MLAERPTCATCLSCALVIPRPCVGSLKADFSGSSSGNHYVLELEGAKFMNGKCDGARVDNDASKGVHVPQAAGKLTVRAAWSARDRKVKIRQCLGFRLRSNVIGHFDSPDI